MRVSSIVAALMIVASPAAAPALSQIATTTARTVTAEWFVGTWSDLRDCSEPFIVTRDGRFRAPNGIWGRWSLAGDLLTLTFGENSQTLRLVWVSEDELKLADSGVSSYRCT